MPMVLTNFRSFIYALALERKHIYYKLKINSVSMILFLKGDLKDLIDPFVIMINDLKLSKYRFRSALVTRINC